jgi:outer membrane protein
LQPLLRGFYNFNTRISYADIVLRDNSGNVIENTGSRILVSSEIIRDNRLSAINIPVFNGFAAKNNVERSLANLRNPKLPYNKIDLQKKCLYCIYRRGVKCSCESSIVALESRQEAYHYAKI